MIRLRLEDGEGAPTFLLGVTSLNIERLCAGKPIRADLGDLGGDGMVAVVYGDHADDLRRTFAEALPVEDVERLAPAFDRLAAWEEELRAARGAEEGEAGAEEDDRPPRPTPLKEASAEITKRCLEAGSATAALAQEGVDPQDALEMASAAHDLDPGHAIIYGVLIGMLYERRIHEATTDVPT